MHTLNLSSMLGYAVIAASLIACGGGGGTNDPAPITAITPTTTPITIPTTTPITIPTTTPITIPTTTTTTTTTPTPTPKPPPPAAGIYLFAKSPDSFTQAGGSGQNCFINTETDQELSSGINMVFDTAGRLFIKTNWLTKIAITGYSALTTVCGNITSESSTPLFSSYFQLTNSAMAIAKNGNIIGSTSLRVGTKDVFIYVLAEIDPTVPGTVTTFPEKLLERIFVVAADGSFYSSDGYIVRKTTATGLSTILAGSPNVANVQTVPVDGTGSMARFGSVVGIAVNAQGDVYVSENGTAIRKISSTGVVATIAGSLTERGALDGTGLAARFGYLNSIVVDSTGNILAVDGRNNAIRKITPQGVVTTVAGKLGVPGYALGALPGLLNSPQALAIDASDVLYLIVSTTLNNQPAVEILKVKL